LADEDQISGTRRFGGQKSTSEEGGQLLGGNPRKTLSEKIGFEVSGVSRTEKSVYNQNHSHTP